MLRFAANLTTMYTEYPFMERFAHAAHDGFHGVEFLFPYEHPPEAIAEELRRHRLEQVLFNAPPGDWSAGERGIASLPGREEEFREGFLRALHYAGILRCPRIHVMAGVPPAEIEHAHAVDLFRTNLVWALEASSGTAIDLLTEPINSRDIPGYLFSRQEEAHRLVREIGNRRLKVQMDLYHCQIMEGDLIMRLRRYLGEEESPVGHIQIAGVPARREPDEGEVHYENIFQTLEQLGYPGWIGCEYKPSAGTSEGLGWFRRYRA
ncbi:2-oxo-tetronate isomerase [Paracidobacterium acidisoli]|uniref:Hydroxypyruvate isomerase n=1 Tax=Paracidobacterium acidisoli TaxID=2303751 RepID=A0A372IQQ2_9BACT|nr:2-oxo-tetronate isomerase [Paracidobacterium acidisoli]MBT9331470.1 hydroxypyruvate isomerase family protein [Paracidobacterium acidisoli]